MGKKKSRRRDSSSEEDRSLLKELRNLVKKRKKHLRRREYSSSSESRSGRSSRSRSQGTRSRSRESEASSITLSPERNKENRRGVAPSTGKPVKDAVAGDASAPSEYTLSKDVINVIGKRLNEERTLAPPVHSSFALRWADILSLGLPSEEKEELIKKYPPPANCTFLDPPKINEEVHHAMNEIARTRDKRIVSKQQKLVACLSGLGKTISSLLLKESADDIPIIEALSDVCRLIADSMHDETSIRRSLIVANVNTAMKDTLRQTTTDNFLFEQTRSDRGVERGEICINSTCKPQTGNTEVRSPEIVQQRLQVSLQEELLPEETLSNSVSSTAGRLNFFYDAWKTFTSNQKILAWIRGYKIPFISTPYQTEPVASKLSKDDENEASILISQLLEKRVTEKCEPVEGQFLSSFFLRPKADNSYRFIFNLKDLNKFILTEHFKLEDHKIAIKLINYNCYMSTIDLKDAYYLISIDPSHRKYLRFEFHQELHEFTCLPFGLCTAPWVFTKLLKPVIVQLRKSGLQSVLYLDDFLLLGNTKMECENNNKITRGLLKSLGFVINEEKSQSTPTQRCKFLGFIFDSAKMTLELPEEKRLSVKKLIDKFSALSKCKIRDFAKFIGTIVACCPAIKFSWIYTKNFEREKYLALITSNGNYNANMVLSPNKSIIIGGKRKLYQEDATSIVERPYPGGRQVIWQAMEKQGVPQDTMEIMISSICNATLKNYDIPLRKWWKFCGDHTIDVFEPNIASIILFLTNEYKKGLSYSSLNGIRSALSLIIAEDIAQDHRMKRFFQGISKSRPSRAKYDRTWDPQIVLKFWQSQPANEDLELKALSKKLISLLALVTAHRMQTFSLIDINNIKISTDKIEILITDRIKTTKRDSAQPILILPFYSNEKICAANTLKFYLEKTRSVRNAIKKLHLYK
ncbi:uncharacterized protein [Prorops nasuta]|uniref:uncharacterized protein n=1 Tax=Prorops nasuta TaxID=863751 RepID=UPI0034CFB542